MIMMKALPKRPRDPAQLAKLVVDLAVQAADKAMTTSGTVASKPQQPVRGQAGGLKGGPARAEALSEEQSRKLPKRLLMSAGRSAAWTAESA